MRCSQFIEGITELALGRQDSRASEHVAGCEACARALSELRAMVAAFRLGSFEAPADVVRRAAAISLPQPAGLRLIRSSLSAAGARRSKAGSFQALYEGDGFQVRVMYTRAGKEWHVMAVATPPVEAIVVDGKRIQATQGGFEFTVATLEATGFQLAIGDGAVEVPAGSKLMNDGDA